MSIDDGIHRGRTRCFSCCFDSTTAGGVFSLILVVYMLDAPVSDDRHVL